MYRSCQHTIFHNVNLLLPEMLHCISRIVGLQINILLMCIKMVGQIAYYHRGHIALKHGSDWNIPMSEFHLARNLSLFAARTPSVTVQRKQPINPAKAAANKSSEKAANVF